MNRLAQLGPAPLKATIIYVNRRGTPRRTRMHSLQDALRGWQDAWNTQPNLRIQTCVALGVIVLGVVLRLSLLEWLWISFAIGLVIFAELMNTAIEQTIDLAVGLAPDPLARQVKDIAAGCVLVAAVLSVIIGTFTFLPHLLRG
jgi:undecaprenol kinase